MRNTRKAISQARFQQGPTRFLLLEFMVVALYIALISDSLILGVVAFFGLSIACVIPFLALMIIIAFTAFWSIVSVQIGYDIGGAFGAMSLGLIGFLTGLGIHFSGLSGFQDTVG